MNVRNKTLIHKEIKTPIENTTLAPKMDSLQEEREFWDSVSNAFEFSSPAELDLNLPKRSKKRLVTLRLSEDQISLLKKLAGIHDKKYQTMVRDWLTERIQAEVRAITKNSLGNKIKSRG